MEVVGDDRTPYICLETIPARPIAASQTITPLQGQNIRFDPGPKVSQPPIHPCALGHFHDRQAAFFGKDYILDLSCPGSRQIRLQSKTAICRTLPGWATVLPGMPLQHRQEPVGVGRVATLNQAIENKVRRWCIAGMGLAAKSSLDMSTDLLSGKVVSIMPEFKPLPTELWLIFPSRQLITPAARLLRDTVKKKCLAILNQLIENGILDDNALA